MSNCEFDRSEIGSESCKTITVAGSKFEIGEDDLETLDVLGHGESGGVVERMLHRKSNTVMAVKVGNFSGFRDDAVCCLQQ